MSLNLRPAEASLIVSKAAEPGCRPGRSQRKSRAITCADRALIQISGSGASAFSLKFRFVYQSGAQTPRFVRQVIPRDRAFGRASRIRESKRKQTKIKVSKIAFFYFRYLTFIFSKRDFSMSYGRVKQKNLFPS
jgi:hypothetical protein